MAQRSAITPALIRALPATAAARDDRPRAPSTAAPPTSSARAVRDSLPGRPFLYGSPRSPRLFSITAAATADPSAPPTASRLAGPAYLCGVLTVAAEPALAAELPANTNGKIQRASGQAGTDGVARSPAV